MFQNWCKLLVVVVVVSVFAAGCQKFDEFMGYDEYGPILKEKEITMQVGEKVTLKYDVVRPKDVWGKDRWEPHPVTKEYTVVWGSEYCVGTGVATVNQEGVVIARRVGQVYITVKGEFGTTKISKCLVTVVAKN